LDVLGGTPIPSTAIDACLWDGFHLNNGVKIRNGAGVLLVAGEAFGWRPWDAGKAGSLNLINAKGQWEVPDEAWGVLGLVWPKPDLLILGLGPNMAPLSPRSRKYLGDLGIRVDIQDTRNASAQFNLLATERGVGSVAAALVPIGWREGVGVKSSES
jgi:NADH dehydrogenase [ubiquinone] 1 alpha subcomplex assembly factor 3